MTARCSTGCREQSPSKTVVWRSPASVRAAYGQSIEYSLSSLVSFVQHYGNDNTVLVLLGDHQPANIVSGQDADHDVPITVVARDRVRARRSSPAGDGRTGCTRHPTHRSARMDTFRDRFLTAFSQ